MIFSPQDFFGKSDPFLVIGCPNPHTGAFETVRTTETKDVGRKTFSRYCNIYPFCQNTLNPDWDDITIKELELNGGNDQINLRFAQT